MTPATPHPRWPPATDVRVLRDRRDSYTLTQRLDETGPSFENRCLVAQRWLEAAWAVEDCPEYRSSYGETRDATVLRCLSRARAAMLGESPNL